MGPVPGRSGTGPIPFRRRDSLQRPRRNDPFFGVPHRVSLGEAMERCRVGPPFFAGEPGDEFSPGPSDIFMKMRGRQQMLGDGVP